MILDGVYWKDAIAAHASGIQRALIETRLKEYRRLGFSYLRDGGDRWGVGALAAELAKEYGIRYRTPIFPIFRKGFYGGFIGRGFDTWADYHALLRELRDRGADFVKLMISGLMDFSRYGVLTEEGRSPEEIGYMIAAAKDAGFSVMAHANGDDIVRAAVLAGVDSVEHGAYLSDETLLLLAQSETVWVPTLSTVGNLLHDGRFPDEALDPILDSQLRAVRFAAGHGASIAPGSDAGAYCVMHGQGGLDEYEWLRQALGEKTDEVLSAGIRKIREKF